MLERVEFARLRKSGAAEVERFAHPPSLAESLRVARQAEWQLPSTRPWHHTKGCRELDE